LPDHLLQSKTLSVQGKPHHPVESPRVSHHAKRVFPISHFYNPHSFAFRTNLPALDLFPTALWAKVVSRRLRQASSNQLLGCETRGYAPLREVLAQYLRTARGVRCEPGQIVIISGIQEALDLVARLLLNPGDRVLIEDPGYQVAYAAFKAVGAKLISVPIDGDGAAPSRQDFRNARLMYVTPGHQFPTGVTMPISRRAEILHHAREAKTFIFEDDYDSEYRYSGSPIPAMQGIDGENRVIFAGSFNKVLFPSLRMGYIILPPALLEVFVMTKAIISRHHSVLDQVAICDFIEEGHFGRHLRRMRNVYAERLEMLSYYVRKQLSDVLTLSDIEAGLQTVAWLKPGISAEDLSMAAADRRVDIVPLNRYCLKMRLPQGIQI
jgi:GntR family transcriptional regulator / MocR family aminotransferase